jgi:hypothetical protein
MFFQNGNRLTNNVNKISAIKLINNKHDSSVKDPTPLIRNSGFFLFIVTQKGKKLMI